MRDSQSVLLILMMMCIPISVLAHQPRMVTSDRITVHKPDISQAFYAELHGHPQTYLIVADRPFDLYLQLTVPKIAHARTDFVLTISRDAHRLQQFDGAATTWKTFNEPFGGDTYLAGPEYEDSDAPPGQYQIAVSSPDNQGKYVLAIGAIESFTLTDWLHTLVVLPKVKAFMGKSPFTAYFNLIGLTVLVPLLVIIFVIVLLARSFRRRRRIRAQRALQDDA